MTNGTVRLDGVAYVVKLLPSSDGNFTLVTYISDRSLMYDLRIFRNIFFGFVVISATFLVIMAWMVKKTVHKPLATIVNSMKLVEQGDYSVAMHYERDDEFGYVYRRFNKMASQLQTLIEEVLMRKIQIQQSELSRLQSHINPHFLYNSLYIGYRMAKSGETEGVAKLCKYLGDYFRFITYFVRNLIAFPDELKFTVTYLKIQKLRYEERLAFSVDAHDGEDPVRIPVLLIQPIVENSVLYGMKDGDGVLLIEVDSWGADSRLRGLDDLSHVIRSLFLETAGGAMLLYGMLQAGLMAGIFQLRQQYSETFLLRKFEEIQDFLFGSMGIQVSYALTYEARWEEIHLQFEYQAARLRQNLIPGQIIRADLCAVVNGHGGAGQRSSEQFIAGVKQYVQQNVSGDLSLDQLSGRLQINPCYLSRVFREITGETLSGYISESRMSEAKRLLTETGEKIYHVATRVGFQNSNYFAKAFRKSVGVSPQEYRLSSRMMSCG